MNYAMFLVTQLVYLFQQTMVALCYKKVTKCSRTSQGAQGFHKHTLNTESEAAGSDSS